MKREFKLTIFMAFLLFGINIQSQELFMYKQTNDTTKLYLEVYKPVAMQKDSLYPAMVFFFGGGWNVGTRNAFIHHARYFSQRGIVCFLADYRTASKNKTTPFEALKDAKSVVRYIRKHSEDYQVDTNKIIASGGSAGGHLAAATALIKAYEDSSDDITISCIPNALVLYNPVIDNGPGGYSYDRVGDKCNTFSPLHNIQKGAPPTIIFLGTKDHLIPVETVEYYKVVMNKVGSLCETKIHEGGKHGFFNYNKKNLTFFKSTITETDEFLQSLDYLKKEPVIEIN